MTNKELADWYNGDVTIRTGEYRPMVVWGSLIGYLLSHDRERFGPIDMDIYRSDGDTLDSVLLYKETYKDTILELDQDSIKTILNL